VSSQSSQSSQPRLYAPLLAAVLGASMHLPANAAPDSPDPSLVRPGAWEVKSGAEGQPMLGYRLCFKNGGTEDIQRLLPHASGNAACSAASTHGEGADVIWELRCPEARFSASARYALQPESIEGKVKITAGTPPRTRLEVISARYVGACAAP